MGGARITRIFRELLFYIPDLALRSRLRLFKLILYPELDRVVRTLGTHRTYGRTTYHPPRTIYFA